MDNSSTISHVSTIHNHHIENRINTPKVILFDLDDTIVAFDSVCLPAWNLCCDKFIEKYQTPFQSSDLIYCIYETKNWYWADPIRHKKGRENLKEARRDVVRFALEPLGIYDEDKVCELADNYTNTQDSMIHLIEGAKEALILIRSLGIKTAVITNGASQLQRGKLERFGLSSLFDEVLIDTEIGYSKPDIRIYQEALRRFHVDPKDTWMVGDNLNWDVFGAKNAGIFSVWNDYENKGLPSDSKVKPDMITPSIYQMAKKFL